MSTEEVIFKVKSIIQAIPKDYTIFIGVTDSHEESEDIAKANCNLPEYWIWESYPYRSNVDYPKEPAVIMDYFLRNSFKNNDGITLPIKRAPEFIEGVRGNIFVLYAKANSTNKGTKKGCFGILLVTFCIVLILAFHFL